MHARKLAAGAAAIVMIAGSALLTAAPASSADEYTICGDFDFTTRTLGPSWSSQWSGDTFNAGDTISLTVEAAIGSPSTVVLEVPVGNPVDSTSVPGTVTYTIPTSGTVNSIALITDDGTGASNLVRVSATSCVPGPEADTAAIPPWQQAYGRGSAAGVCLEGWNPSWQQWPNGGTGGYVCERIVPSLG